MPNHNSEFVFYNCEDEEMHYHAVAKDSVSFSPLSPINIHRFILNLCMSNQSQDLVEDTNDVPEENLVSTTKLCDDDMQVIF
eukprot:snap_masked-scaffold_2-processed-gene-16.26-mRNA-1 protein AED:1.00 eAED:1.00 QI:0/0/0/0/1/1/2/0/81